MNEIITVLSYGLIAGVAMSAVLGLIILASLCVNARLWLHDYPKPMQERVPPLSARERWARMALAVVFFGVIIVVPVIGIGQLEQALGGNASFLAAFAFSLIVFNLFNLFDAVVLDYLILAQRKPKFAILPGTEDLVYLFDDVRSQRVNFAKGVIFCVIGSLIVAVLAVH